MTRPPIRGVPNTGPRWKWRAARLFDRLPFTCWTQLVWWALPGPEPRLRDCRIDEVCRRDAERTGVCYCGKIGADRPEQPEPEKRSTP